MQTIYNNRSFIDTFAISIKTVSNYRKWLWYRETGNETEHLLNASTQIGSDFTSFDCQHGSVANLQHVTWSPKGIPSQVCVCASVCQRLISTGSSSLVMLSAPFMKIWLQTCSFSDWYETCIPQCLCERICAYMCAFLGMLPAVDELSFHWNY